MNWLVRDAIILVVVSGLLTGVYTYVEGKGFDRGVAKTTAELQPKIDELQKNYDALTNQVVAQTAANKEAADQAAEIYRRAIETASLQNQELQDVIQENDTERDADPDGAQPGLDVDGVRRLNRIR